ncbi:UDPGT domain containing protein [Trichuris trichiura]|uniref:glucuronosyltransferase n=1 Tax=Trichuris trichiura TaxID=36087 RepID=A0A077Z4K4_TRITR|nr:UDPGT domain containing protein [Trichuris trichiura]
MINYAIPMIAIATLSIHGMKTAKAKHILFMPAMAAPSHVKSMLPLAKELLNDGHNVSLVQFYNEGEKITSDSINFIYLPMSEASLIDKEQQTTIWRRRGVNPWTFLKSAWKISTASFRSRHNEDQVEFYQNLTARKWDLLIPSGLHYATNTKGQAWIDYSTTLMLQCIRQLRAAHVPPSVELTMSMETYQPRNFKSRLIGVLDYFVQQNFWLLFSTLLSRASIDDFYTNAVYSIGSMSSMLDIILPQTMNTFSIDYACPKAANLTYEYQNFVEDPSSKGTIVFSFGHLADWQGAPVEIIQAISAAFEQLPQYRIVWQFNGNVSMVSGKPNLKIDPWIPLPALLQHSRTVLFITHSGIKSFREAVCFAVPMLSIPLFGDQVRNTILTKFHGLGVSLDKTRLTEETFYKGILSVLHNSGYKQRITKLSAMLSDNLIDETKKGSFWISFYLRHPQSASHITTPMLQPIRILRAVSLPPSVELTMSTLLMYSIGSMPTMLDIILPQTMNTFSLDYACPKVGNLSHEYQNFVEDPSSKGTIVFSFGHLADWQGAPVEIIQAISAAFEQLPQYRIVWQFNGNVSMVSGKPNLKIDPWIPLPALLQHSKTILFITHSGIKSFREAVCFAVPMLSIPLFGDQVRITALMVMHGFGIRLDKTKLTRETFYSAMWKVLQDRSYKQRIAKLSAMLSDNVIDETKKGSFWISFYLRHPQSGSHMRLKGITMASLTYRSFDVLGFMCILLLAFYYIIHSVQEHILPLLPDKLNYDVR